MNKNEKKWGQYVIWKVKKYLCLYVSHRFIWNIVWFFLCEGGKRNIIREKGKEIRTKMHNPSRISRKLLTKNRLQGLVLKWMLLKGSVLCIGDRKKSYDCLNIGGVPKEGVGGMINLWSLWSYGKLYNFCGWGTLVWFFFYQSDVYISTIWIYLSDVYIPI